MAPRTSTTVIIGDWILLDDQYEIVNGLVRITDESVIELLDHRTCTVVTTTTQVDMMPLAAPVDEGGPSPVLNYPTVEQIKLMLKGSALEVKVNSEYTVYCKGTQFYIRSSNSVKQLRVDPRSTLKYLSEDLVKVINATIND